MSSRRPTEGEPLEPANVPRGRGKAGTGLFVLAALIVLVVVVSLFWADDAPDLSPEGPDVLITDDELPAGDLGN